jgi:hypothetical protein
MHYRGGSVSRASASASPTNWHAGRVLGGFVVVGCSLIGFPVAGDVHPLEWAVSTPVSTAMPTAAVIGFREYEPSELVDIVVDARNEHGRDVIAV